MKSRRKRMVVDMVSEILQRGEPMSVRQIVAECNRMRPNGDPPVTSIIKSLQLMADNGTIVLLRVARHKVDDVYVAASALEAMGADEGVNMRDIENMLGGPPGRPANNATRPRQ